MCAALKALTLGEQLILGGIGFQILGAGFLVGIEIWHSMKLIREDAMIDIYTPVDASLQEGMADTQMIRRLNVDQLAELLRIPTVNLWRKRGFVLLLFGFIYQAIGILLS